MNKYHLLSVADSHINKPHKCLKGELIQPPFVFAVIVNVNNWILNMSNIENIYGIFKPAFSESEFKLSNFNNELLFDTKLVKIKTWGENRLLKV